jgi:hypothetical protein
MTTLKMKVSGVWTPVAGEVQASNPVNTAISDIYAKITPTGWTYVTAWTNGFGPTSVNAKGPLRYRKIGDLVYLEGGCLAGATNNLPMTTLPAGHTPGASTTRYFTVVDEVGPVTLIVGGDASLVIWGGTTGHHYELNGVFWSTI